MPMLVHIPTLSWWEIAHYWHGHDPRDSNTHRLPLDVRDTLLVLATTCGKKLSLRVEHHQAYLLEILKSAPRFTARHYRHTITKAINNKVFGKRFFSNMLLTRSQLGRWCIQHKEPFPAFWFPDNEKYPFAETGDISHEITVNGRYVVQLIYDDTLPIAPGDALPAEFSEAVTTTVSENAVKAANVKHAPINAIKERFVQFYLECGTEHGSKTAAARHFFNQELSSKEQYLFTSRETAVRTLLDNLREGQKKGI